MGLSMVWMTNKAEFLARPTHHGLSMVMLTKPSMNPSIEVSFALIFTASWYALTSVSEVGR